VLQQSQVALADELEQVAPQAIAAAAIIGEEDGHDFFGQMLQGKYRSVEVGHIGG
jgi:hypothetical protein